MPPRFNFNLKSTSTAARLKRNIFNFLYNKIFCSLRQAVLVTMIVLKLEMAAQTWIRKLASFVEQMYRLM